MSFVVEKLYMASQPSFSIHLLIDQPLKSIFKLEFFCHFNIFSIVKVPNGKKREK